MTTNEGLNEDFRDLLALLAEERVEFLIVGAHALAAHGATGDLDVWVRADQNNARRVIQALRRLGASLAQHGVTERDFATTNTVYQMGLPPRRIDVLTSVSGVSFDEAWPDRVTIRTAALEFPYLGSAALLKNRRAAGRPKDLVDAELLEKQRRSS